ncbi:hypothetical protein F3Y22_tig00012104pilonHSYRG00094 [Hibiscus syriacus]|uniref:Uncharacterized protein n=1 Tax=Hibiscus syriacus TaxID=106335 RepID=A0A6A3C396_HIBSY|nr:hypothetical protein F3Y22_tig00012104pilonHSYRG00094 [Hibiscus syriacus]
METRCGFGSDSGYLGPYPANRAIQSEPSSPGGESGRNSVRSRAYSIDNGGVYPPEQRWQRGRAEPRFDTVIKSLLGEFLDRKPAEGGGREAVRTKQREKNREDFWVAVDEDGVRTGKRRTVGESSEEGISTGGVEGGDGGLEKPAADVELYAAAGNLWVGNLVSHRSSYKSND